MQCHCEHLRMQDVPLGPGQVLVTVVLDSVASRCVVEDMGAVMGGRLVARVDRDGELGGPAAIAVRLHRAGRRWVALGIIEGHLDLAAGSRRTANLRRIDIDLKYDQGGDSHLPDAAGVIPGDGKDLARGQNTAVREDLGSRDPEFFAVDRPRTGVPAAGNANGHGGVTVPTMSLQHLVRHARSDEQPASPAVFTPRSEGAAVVGPDHLHPPGDAQPNLDWLLVFHLVVEVNDPAAVRSDRRGTCCVAAMHLNTHPRAHGGAGCAEHLVSGAVQLPIGPAVDRQRQHCVAADRPAQVARDSHEVADRQVGQRNGETAPPLVVRRHRLRVERGRPRSAESHCIVEIPEPAEDDVELTLLALHVDPGHDER